MNVYLTITLLLSLIHTLYALPRTVTEAPNYPQYTRSGRTFSPKSPAPFTSNVEYETESSETQQRPLNYPYAYQNAIQIKQKPQQAPRGKGQQYLQEERLPKNPKVLEEEEEIEEPDRLSQLLPQSKFDCSNKNTGYYADEDLGCEVFHYCQDNAKHSWICPEGFTFHQVHLICMPPGGDNICEKSSKFHFVNEYLYKPVNLEEYQQKPNVSLRYHERFYPENYYEGNEQNDEQEARPVPQHRNSIRVQQHAQEQVRPALRPETTIGQVFRSPNEVNIPLQQRRPQYLPQFFAK